MDQELLNRASCIDLNILSDIGGANFSLAVNLYQHKVIKDETFVMVLEKAEETISYIRRLEMLRKLFYTIPDFAPIREKALSIISKLSTFNFKDGKYVSGRIERHTLVNIESMVFTLFSKCYNARITLIMIRRFRDSELSIIPRDVVNLIATEVWKTRFEEVWFK